MRASFHHVASATALGLLAGGGVSRAQGADPMQLQEIIIELQERNQALERSLVEANRGEREAAEQLARVRERLEALGKNLLDGGDDRLIQAAADLQIANERIAELESSISRLVGSVQDYLRQAVVSDPDARLRVETSLRELDAVLGLRQKPRPDVRTGSLREARVVSLDQESGMLVLNIGENQGARIGMTFRITRGQQPIGTVILADVRKAVSGVFVESLDDSADVPRPGDTANLETQPSAQ